MLFSADLTTAFFCPFSSKSKHSTHSPVILRCSASAADPPAGISFPTISYNGGIRVPRDSDVVAGQSEMTRNKAGSSGIKNSSKINIRKIYGSRNTDSYLNDDTDVLPLPMAYPNTSPVSSDEIDRRLACDPQFEDCKAVVYEWTGICRNCQGSGYASYRNKRGKETFCKCLPCLGIGFVQKITARDSIELMEDINNGKPPDTRET